MATELDTARYNAENFKFCAENGHIEWLIKASRCVDFFHGRQWAAEDVAALREAGRPALTFNVIESLIRTMRGIQRMLRNDVRYVPVADAGAEDARAQDMVWLHIQNQNALEHLESELWVKGLITGRAYYEVCPSFDESLQGNVKISGLRSQDVVLDPAFETYDPSDWPQVFVSRWWSLNDIKLEYGDSVAEQLRYSTPPDWLGSEELALARQLGKYPYYSAMWSRDVDRDNVRAFRLVDRQYVKVKNKDVFVDMATGDISEIPESWDRERVGRVLEMTPGLGTMRKKMKTVRWTVSTEDVVLKDVDSPNKWYTVVPFFPTMVDGETQGLIEHLVDPQVLYNKVTSQELHIINTTANSGWKFKTGTLVGMTREELERVGSRTGLALEVRDLNDIEKIQPNQIPQGHDRISGKADAIMRSLSGVSNQARGFAREDVAGEAILANQAAMDVNFAGPLANLHRSKQLLAMRSLDCVQAYYTETRVLLINKGSMFRPDLEEMTVNQPTVEGRVLNDLTQGKYTTTLIPSPPRSTLSESEFKELVMLRRDLGLQIPDAVFIEVSNLANKAQLLQQMQGDSLEAQKAQQEAAARAQQMEEQKVQAQVEKELGAAELNRARAQKATIESQYDPDAAYERVEMARIQSDAGIERERMELGREDARREQRNEDRRLALDLTRIDAENARHQQKVLVDTLKAAREAATPKEATTRE